MPSTFILSASTVVDPDVQSLRVGNINYGYFIKDMGMLWRKDVIAQLVYEHMDRLSRNKPINDTDDSGLLRFEFISVLTESDMLFKTNGRQTRDVKEVKKLNDIIAHTTCSSSSRACSRCCSSRRTRHSHAFGQRAARRHERYDLNVNFQASDSRDKFFMERCLCGSWTRHHMAFG